ncbi:MAG: TonB family protein [Candidatus Cloacimonadales bacterium]
MKEKIYRDWKDVASSYYEKCAALAILILLFAFLVSPNLDVKTYQAEVKITEAIEIPPEIKEKIKPPETTVKPQIEIVIDDDLSADEDEDIDIIETIETTSLDMSEESSTSELGKTSKFAVYEDPPVAIKQVPPVYPDFARRNNIEGQVYLEVEVLVDGSVGAIEVRKSLMPGPGGLDEAAINAVKQWKYQPARSNDKPVAVWITFPVDFYLN